jgi:hypothetical protein
LAPVLRIAGGCNPTIFATKVKGLPEAWCTTDHALSINDSMPVAGLLKGCHYAFGELDCFRNHHIQCLDIQVTVPVEFTEAVVTELFLEDKIDIPLIYPEMTHPGVPPSSPILQTI